ncbi:hypothetical protein JW933_11450 [candidate division FCPU426 bacterium]|nr:hypothetical protein [candidate division FCPU426 bacterium]
MAREIKQMQTYQDRLLKLIPSEIIGAYLFLQGIIPPDQAKWGTTLVGVALLIMTPLYMQRIQKVSKKTQLLVTTLSFAVWVYSLGGPFSLWGLYQAWIGSVVLVLWTMTVPLFFSNKEPQEQPA